MVRIDYIRRFQAVVFCLIGVLLLKIKKNRFVKDLLKLLVAQWSKFDRNLLNF